MSPLCECIKVNLRFSYCRLLDRDQVTGEEDRTEDEEDNDLLKAFKVLSCSYLLLLAFSLVNQLHILYEGPKHVWAR